MKKNFALGILVSIAASASAATVNFDDKGFVPYDDVTTQYQSQGVIFQGFLSSGAPVNLEASNETVFFDNVPSSSPIDLSNFYGDWAYNRATIMRIQFTAPTSGIGLMYNAAGWMGDKTAFKVYDPNGSLLNSYTIPSAIDSNFHPLTIPDVGVGYIDIVVPQSGWGHYIDDLTFNQDGRVPDWGSTSMLLGLGLAAVAGLRKRLA
jgi:hypothetical protein